jgi:hypothetical protein
MILWKIGKFEEAKRYIDINRKLIEVLLDEESGRKGSESQLSVIMEAAPSSKIDSNKGAGQSRTLQEATLETGESLTSAHNPSSKSASKSSEAHQRRLM